MNVKIYFLPEVDFNLVEAEGILICTQRQRWHRGPRIRRMYYGEEWPSISKLWSKFIYNAQQLKQCRLVVHLFISFIYSLSYIHGRTVIRP